MPQLSRIFIWTLFFAAVAANAAESVKPPSSNPYFDCIKALGKNRLGADSFYLAGSHNGARGLYVFTRSGAAQFQKFEKPSATKDNRDLYHFAIDVPGERRMFLEYGDPRRSSDLPTAIATFDRDPAIPAAQYRSLGAKNANEAGIRSLLQAEALKGVKTVSYNFGRQYRESYRGKKALPSKKSPLGVLRACELADQDTELKNAVAQERRKLEGMRLDPSRGQASFQDPGDLPAR